MSEEIPLSHANLNALIELNEGDSAALTELLRSDEDLHPEVRRLLADIHAPDGSFKWKARVSRRHPGPPPEEARRGRIALGKRVEGEYRARRKLESALTHLIAETGLSRAHLKKARREWLEFVKTGATELDELAHLNMALTVVPIGSVATFNDETAPYRVPRYNLFPAADVLGAAAPGVASGTAMARMEELAKEVLPPGFTFEWTELSHQQEQQGIPTIAIFAASAVFVFLVLAAQYESWKLPLAIVLIVPMCLLASATGLDFRGMPIDILAQIGFVVLVGLAAKNAILIVEFARQRQDHDGDAPEEAATAAARIRLRPILMTSFAFILGVLPLAVASGAGSEMRQSLGTAVFFGMLGVTVFGLLVTPAFYTFIRKIGSRNAS
jgi:Cu/Ag efflux pump CusA